MEGSTGTKASDGLAIALSLVIVFATILLTWCTTTQFSEYTRRVNWHNVSLKLFSGGLVMANACFAVFLWYNCPWGPGGNWPASPVGHGTLAAIEFENNFQNFQGASTCSIKAADLFVPPVMTDSDYGYCNSTSALLTGLSEGGRHGFDAPYVPRGINYRCFTVQEMCAILDRFDGVMFVGDQNAAMIYAGFNILLREDLQSGAMKTWPRKNPFCTCNDQFTNHTCHEDFIHGLPEGTYGGYEGLRKEYTCKRMHHAYVEANQSPASSQMVHNFNYWMEFAPHSENKSTPIIHSVTRNADIEVASQSMDEFRKLAHATKRKTPMLWLGPTAAGCDDPCFGRNGNGWIWHFAAEMTKNAAEMDFEVLNLWNLTVQATSYDDGKAFGEEVYIVIAMMVINWLSLLD